MNGHLQPFGQHLGSHFSLLFFLGTTALSAQPEGRASTIATSLMVSRSMPYPEAAENAGIEGTVLVEFTIDRLCNIQNKRVIRGLGYGLDELALKVIDKKYEEALTKALSPCVPDTLVVPVRFDLRD